MVDDFQTTNHVPEALARLTEIYLVLGLADQAKKTAAVLGYNYPGSEWYADTYTTSCMTTGWCRRRCRRRAAAARRAASSRRAWHSVF